MGISAFISLTIGQDFCEALQDFVCFSQSCVSFPIVYKNNTRFHFESGPKCLEVMVNENLYNIYTPCVPWAQWAGFSWSLAKSCQWYPECHVLFTPPPPAEDPEYSVENPIRQVLLLAFYRKLNLWINYFAQEYNQWMLGFEEYTFAYLGITFTNVLFHFDLWLWSKVRRSRWLEKWLTG